MVHHLPQYGNGLQYKHKTDVSYLYCSAFLFITRAYNVKTAFLPLFTLSEYFPLHVWYICKRVEKYALKIWLLCAARRLAFIYSFCAFFLFFVFVFGIYIFRSSSLVVSFFGICLFCPLCVVLFAFPCFLSFAFL